MTYKKIEVESRWDYLKIPIKDMPEGGLLFSGKDRWFLTNRDHIRLQHELGEYLDNIMEQRKQTQLERVKKMRNTQQEQMYLSNAIGDYKIPLKDKFELIQMLQKYKDMENEQGILSAEEVAQLRPEDVTDYSTSTISGEEFDFFGDTNAPILFEIREEGRSTLCVRGWNTAALVSFGNYMLLRYPEKIHDAELRGDIIMGVTDADIANWRFLFAENDRTVSDTVSTNDGVLYPNEYFDNEGEALAEQSRTGGI